MDMYDHHAPSVIILIRSDMDDCGSAGEYNGLTKIKNDLGEVTVIAKVVCWFRSVIRANNQVTSID